MSKPSDIISGLKGQLIVSCQAEGDEPLNRPDILTAMAMAAVQGGAGVIRAGAPENIRAMRSKLSVPMIGPV